MHVEHEFCMYIYYKGIEFAQSVSIKCVEFALYMLWYPNLTRVHGLIITLNHYIIVGYLDFRSL